MTKRDETRLSRYVRRVMQQNGLTQRDVELRSGGEITDGYVSNILSGAATNLSALKIKGLARGLGVDAHELFDVVCGPLASSAGRSRELDIVLILELIQVVAKSPELMKFLEEAIELEREDRKVMIEAMESLNRHKRKTKARKRSVGRK
jgi:transcriptional regulator with XRE-family HTH domain